MDLFLDDNEYPKVFFLMHKWIMESEYLSNMLYDLYKHTEDDLRRANNTADESSFKNYQFRICQAYQYVAHCSLFARISTCPISILVASGWRTIRCISISIDAWKKPARRWKIWLNSLVTTNGRNLSIRRRCKCRHARETSNISWSL